MTKIEWADKTWNPVTGCTPVSPGCEHCYAKRMAKRLAGRYGYPKDDPFAVTFHPEQLEKPLHWKKPSRIFVCSMGDLYHKNVHPAWYWQIFDVIKECPQHTFIVLTKRPENIPPFGSITTSVWPPNLWLGVTVESPDYLWRIDKLLEIPAAVRFVSLEPLLGPVDLQGGGAGAKRLFLSTIPCFEIGPPTPTSSPFGASKYTGKRPGLDWVIVGGETGPGARPVGLNWIMDIRDACIEASVPFFLKHRGGKKWAGSRLLCGREWNEFPTVAENATIQGERK